MYTLALDSSAKAASVALFCGEKLIGEAWHQYANTHSEHFMTLIDFVLCQHSVEIAEVKRIVVLNGPGSYTGLRIGLATAKALAQPFNIPIYPVSTLDALAFQQLPHEGMVVVIMDARNEQIYGAAYDLKRKTFDEVVKKGAYAIDAFLALLPKRKTYLLCGDGAALHAKRMEDLGLGEIELASCERMTQRAFAGAGLVFLENQTAVTDFHGLQADYLRKSQAERQLGQRG